MIRTKDLDFYNNKLLIPSLEKAEKRSKTSKAHRTPCAVGNIGVNNLTEENLKDYINPLEEPEVIAAAAISVEINEEQLRRVAVIEHPLVQEAMARNPKTPERYLKAMASVKHDNVRMAVAQNPSTPWMSVMNLQNDSNLEVRKMAESRQA